MIKVLKNNYELLLITVAAFAIRLINLGKLNLWLDEGITAETIHSGLGFILRDSFTAEPTPPLYNIFMYGWVQVFGDSEFSLRLPSVFFGALSISLVYLIGKKYVSKEVGILSSILLIGNPFYLFYSQEARCYSMFAFLALLSVYYFPKGLEWRDNKKYLWATLFVPWLHAYGVFLILAQNLYVLIKFESRNKNFLKNWLKYQAIIISSASVWYFTFLVQNKKYLNRFLWISPVSFKDVFELLKNSIGKGEFIPEIIFGMSFLMALIYKKKNREHDLKLFYLWPLVTILLPVIIGFFWHPFFMERYAIASSMVIAILIFSPFDSLLKQSKMFFIALVLLVVCFNAYEISNYFKSIKKEEWTSVINVILKNDQQKAVVVLEEYIEESSMDYYVRKMNLEEKIQLHYLKDLREMKSLIKNHDHIWFIYSEALSPKELNDDQYFKEEKFSQPNQYLQLIKMKTR